LADGAGLRADGRLDAPLRGVDAGQRRLFTRGGLLGAGHRLRAAQRVRQPLPARGDAHRAALGERAAALPDAGLHGSAGHPPARRAAVAGERRRHPDGDRRRDRAALASPCEHGGGRGAEPPAQGSPARGAHLALLGGDDSARQIGGGAGGRAAPRHGAQRRSGGGSARRAPRAAPPRRPRAGAPPAGPLRPLADRELPRPRPPAPRPAPDVRRHHRDPETRHRQLHGPGFRPDLLPRGGDRPQGARPGGDGGGRGIDPDLTIGARMAGMAILGPDPKIPHRRSAILLLPLLALLACTGPAAVFQAGRLASIRLPEGFSIAVFSDQVPGARSLALSPKGIVYVGTRDAGKVYAVVDRDRDGRADEVRTIASGLRSPNGVAWRDGALYVAEVSRLLRFDGIDGRLADPPAPKVIIDTYPTDGHHGWKFIRFGPDGKLYVPVGAPCNVCDAENPIYA